MPVGTKSDELSDGDANHAEAEAGALVTNILLGGAGAAGQVSGSSTMGSLLW